MIDMYYSRHGLRVMAQSTVLSACQRYDNFREKIDHNKLQSEAFTFALELKTHLVSSISEASLKNAVAFAHEASKQEVEKLEIGLARSYFECTDDFILGPSSVQGNDLELHNTGIADVGLILDTSIFASEDDIYQQQLAASLALQLDIWYV